MLIVGLSAEREEVILTSGDSREWGMPGDLAYREDKRLYCVKHKYIWPSRRYGALVESVYGAT